MSDRQWDANKISIKTAVFEGPLELLLDLVERRKLLINDISLADVTDEYMSYVSAMQERSLPNTTQFVQMAATLLLIKSKSLLPVLQLTEEEEAGIDDLEDRLRLLQIYRKASESIKDSYGKKVAHSRQYNSSGNEKPLFVTDRLTNTKELHQAILRVVNNLPAKPVPPKVKVRPTITLEEMIIRLQKRIERQFSTSLNELVAGNRERTFLIVGFLAILESVKQGMVTAKQPKHFANIEVTREEIGIPNYHL